MGSGRRPAILQNSFYLINREGLSFLFHNEYSPFENLVEARSGMPWRIQALIRAGARQRPGFVNGG